MIRFVIAASIVHLFSVLVLSAAASESGNELLEPIVKRHVGVLPPSVCRELIALGEEKGFTVDVESFDDDEEENNKVISQSIEVFERDGELSLIV